MFGAKRTWHAKMYDISDFKGERWRLCFDFSAFNVEEITGIAPSTSEINLSHFLEERQLLPRRNYDKICFFRVLKPLQTPIKSSMLEKSTVLGFILLQYEKNGIGNAYIGVKGSHVFMNK